MNFILKTAANRETLGMREEEDAMTTLSRKELRKRKLAEYLAAKGRVKGRPAQPSVDEKRPPTRPPVTSVPRLVDVKENKAPRKGVSSAGVKGQGARPDPGTKVLSVSNKVNIGGGAAASQKKTCGPVSACRRPQDPGLTRTRVAPASRSGPRPAAGVPAPVRAPPDARRTLTVKPGGRIPLGSKAASVGPAGSRVSLGPLVTTRTGLIPTLPQVRVAKPSGAHASVKAPTGTAPSGRRPPGSVSRSAEVKGHVDTKLHGKAPGRPADTRTSARPAPKAAVDTSDPRSAAGGGRVDARTTSDPTFQSSFRSVSGRWRPAAAARQRKPSGSAKVGPGAAAIPQTAPQPLRTIRLTGHTTKTPTAAVRPIPQTERKKVTAAQEERMRKLQEWRQAKGISYKRPSMPAPSTVRRPVPVCRPFWESMKKEDDAHSLISAVDSSLADCLKLLEEGCPPDQVGGVLSRLPPVSQKFTRYWICRARLMERRGDLDVLPVFEEAVRVVVEPVDELRSVVFEILKKKDELRAALEENQSRAEASPQAVPDSSVTPRPVRALLWTRNGDSSVVKYQITATPGGLSSQKRRSARIDGQEVRFFTPVRRSVRIEKSSRRYPAALQDHDPCVASYDDLFHKEVGGVTEQCVDGVESGDATMYVYRENQALGDKVLVQLVDHETSVMDESSHHTTLCWTTRRETTRRETTLLDESP